MKKTKISNLDLDLYYEKLENGLEIYVVPKKNVKNVYVTYTSKYGSNIVDFKNNGELFSLPYGVAHFLEHKVFEQKNGISPFEEFDKNGANCNAFTNYNQTTYLWSGPDKFEENMKILLNFVNNPYFTDSNVKKEKGIIIQELKMYDDSPFRYGIKKIFENTFINHPIRIDIGGTIESVNSITKEDLYNCYNTFYNPSNMFIVVSGNVCPKETINIIKENYKKKNIKNNIETKKYDEPNNVLKKEETVNMNVTIPKVLFGIKLNMNDVNISHKLYKQYISIYLDSIIRSTSDFVLTLKENNIITDDLDYYIEGTDDHLLVVILGESKKYKKLANLIKEELKKNIDKKTFERKKKCFLSAIINSTDNIYGINNAITTDIINNNEFDVNLYNQVNSLNYKEFVNFIKQINFDNISVLYIKSIKKK